MTPSGFDPITKVTRTKSIKGFLTIEEKLQFIRLVDHFGMKQQDVISFLAAWFLKQSEDIQISVLSPQSSLIKEEK